MNMKTHTHFYILQGHSLDIKIEVKYVFKCFCLILQGLTGISSVQLLRISAAVTRLASAKLDIKQIHE